MPGPVVDCAVHEPFDQHAVARHIDPVWTGWHPIVPPLPYRLPSGKRPVAAVFDAIRDEVLEAHHAEVAVLGGSIHPGNARTQLEYHAAFASAYNDWLASEWLTRDERLYGSIHVVPQVPERAVAEIERMAINPRMLQVVLPARGGEGFGTSRYRPIFEAAERHDLVVALHRSDSSHAATGFPESLAEWHATASQAFMGQVLSLVFSGIFEEMPRLKVVLCGGGWTWLPYLLWTMDANYRPLRAEVPWVPRLPSEYLDGHLYLAANPVPPTASPEHLVRTVEMAGADGWLVWGSGYPHADFSSPDVLDALGADLAAKVAYDNGRKLYGERLAKEGAPA